MHWRYPMLLHTKQRSKDSPYHSTDNMQHPVTKLIQNCSKHQRTTKDFWYILKPSFLSNVQFRPLAGCKDLPSPHWHFLRTVSSVQKTAGSVDGRVCTCGIEAWAVEQGSKSLDFFRTQEFLLRFCFEFPGVLEPRFEVWVDNSSCLTNSTFSCLCSEVHVDPRALMQLASQ